MLGQHKCNRKDRSSVPDSLISDKRRLLRAIDAVIDLEFFRAKVEPFFSDIGRESIDPVVMFRMMLVGYLFGVRSDREIVQDCIDRHSFREFIGYGDDEKIPVHSNFTNWRKKLGPRIFESAIEETLKQAESHGMRIGTCRLYDSTRVEARASKSNKTVTTEIVANESVADYLDAFDWQTEYHDPREDPRFGEKLVINANDREARLLRHEKEPARFVHNVHMAADSHTGLITKTTASFLPEHEVMLQFLAEETRRITSAGADSKYGPLECFHKLDALGIDACIPYYDHATEKRKGFFNLYDFTYDTQTDTYTCPAGKTLRRNYRKEDKKLTGYIAGRNDCSGCEMRSRCIQEKTKCRTLAVNDERPYVEEIKRRGKFPKHQRVKRLRGVVIEGTFAHAKQWCAMDRARGIGLAAMRIQAALTAVVINIKKVVAHIRQKQAESGQEAAEFGQIPAFAARYAGVYVLLHGLIRLSRCLLRLESLYATYQST
jgi:transposase